MNARKRRCLEKLESRFLLAAMPFEMSRLSDAQIDATIVRTGSVLAELLVADGHRLRGYNPSAQPDFRPDLDMAFDAEIRDVSVFPYDEWDLVATANQVWRVYDNDRRELLLDNLPEIVAIGETSGIDHVLFVAHAERIMKYEFDGLDNLRQPTPIVEAEIVGVGTQVGHDGVFYGVASGESVDVYRANIELELITTLSPASRVNIQFVSHFPDAAVDDLLITSDTGQVIIVDGFPLDVDVPPTYLEPVELFPAMFRDSSAGQVWTTATDLDNNGLFDLVVNEYALGENGVTEPTTYWRENRGSYFDTHLLPSETTSLGRVAVVDTNLDGQVDLVSFGASGVTTIEFAAAPSAEFPFGPGTIVGKRPDLDWLPNAVTTGDINGDGRDDIVAGGKGTTSLAWYPNLGNGVFGAAIAIDRDQTSVQAITAKDFDGDGDADLFYASLDVDQLHGFYWRENLGRGSEFSTPIQLGPALNRYREREFAVAEDFDGDGDVDLLTGEAWFENQGGRFSEKHMITDGRRPVNLAVGDIDQDGDLDLVTHLDHPGVRSDMYVYVNNGGRFERGTVLWEDGRTLAGPIALVDVDSDEYLELLWGGYGYFDTIGGTLSDSLTSFEFQGRPPRFNRDAIVAIGDLNGDGTNEHVLGDTTLQVLTLDGLAASFQLVDSILRTGNGFDETIVSIAIADLDEDGQADILIASPTEVGIAWYRNQGDSWSARQRPGVQQPFTGLSDTILADLDGDDDVDIVARDSLGRPGWYRNEGGESVFGAGIRLGEPVDGLSVIDLDRDGDQDLVIRSGREFSWRPNLDGQATFGEIVPLGIEPAGPVRNGAYAASVPVDLDGDGDEDLLTAGVGYYGTPTWFENRGVDAPLLERVVETEPRLNIRASWVIPADLDGDGDSDFVHGFTIGFDESSAFGIEWFENTDGQGRFVRSPIENRSLYSDVTGVGLSGISVVDFDGDGDQDVVSMSSMGVFFYKNRGDADRFGDGELLLTERDAQAVIDFDADGDYDVIGAERWFENVGNDHDFHNRMHAVDGIHRLHVADLDGDQRSDLIVFTAGFRNPDQLIWHQNISASLERNADVNGDGTLDGRDVDRLCRAISQAETNAAFDLDRSQRVDLADLETLFGQLDSVFGDVNFDGRFDSSDLVSIFAAGLYEQGRSDAAMQTTGDLNCDGQVSTRDLVWALTKSEYQT